MTRSIYTEFIENLSFQGNHGYEILENVGELF